jgi:hypothetical protein
MASIRGKIENPVSISANVISEIESPVNVNISTDVHYNASSLSTFIETETALFLPTDLSNAKNLYVLSNPQNYGNTIFSNLLTEKFIVFSLSGNSSDSNMSIKVEPNNELLYIDGGKKYKLLSSRNESKNFGWEPVSNRYQYSHIERTDFDSFDFPQVSISGTRKIPTTTADTLCGPVTYTGYTYDRLNYNWFFGSNAGISFNPIQSGGTPVSITGSVISQEGVSSISNVEGKLLFYTNGETIYTSGNTIMVNGTGLSSSGTSTQSSIIVPKPNSNKYYVFTNQIVKYQYLIKLMEFFCVYVKTRKKLDKYIKVNRIRNKYIIDIKKIIEEEDISFDVEKTYLKIIIFQKIQQAIEKKKDIYYVPDFESDFSIEKLINIRKILGEQNNFNVLVFYNEFRKNQEILDDLFSNLSKFTASQIIRDY